MKRSHNYSSSDSDLDDNVDVEKDSGDENGYVYFVFYFKSSASHVSHFLCRIAVSFIVSFSCV